jgi:hypothetical protein
MSHYALPVLLRALTFALASLSFACLLGDMYGVWKMRAFACLVFPVMLAALAFIAWKCRGRAAATWIIEGALAGIVAAIAYDLFRLPFVLAGIPLFKVFPQFGEMLLGATEPRWLVQLLGWTYHFSNGAALGIMFLSAAPPLNRRGLFWAAVAFATCVELALLSTPYPTFFGLALNARFIALTLSAHLIFGAALGLWLSRRPALHLKTAT